MKANIKNIIILLIIVGIVIVGASFLSGKDKDGDAFVYSDLIQLFEDDLVRDFVIDENATIELNAYVATKNSDGKFTYELDENGARRVIAHSYTFSYELQLERIMSIVEANVADGVTNLQSYNFEPAAETPWYLTPIAYVIITGVIFIGITIFFVARQSGGGAGKMGGFARSKAKMVTNDKNAVKFADVAGADEEKAELEEVVEFLKDPSKFVRLGARIPRGVLLVGPPGTGKTLLAKAVAGEAGVPFFSISGSDFVQMYVGVGASRVRDLFDNARKTPASIIFIDEIDAVGRHRGAGLGGGHDEREQTLNQLLVEMDGFGTNSGVIVMAATNRPDILDPALLRPGRFDRRVTVNYPDIKGREEILKVHCRNKPLEETVNLKKIAQTTIGFTGAELANLMNEAALRAAKKNKALIGMVDIEESYMKLILGPQKKTKVRTEADNKLCAYHEAGHAVASYFCKHTDPVKHITIIPAGNAGGVTVSVPVEDRLGMSKNQMLDIIVRALGGRVAEEIILDDISTGASSDIQQATGIARNMVTRYGMSEKLGTVLYGSEHSSDEVFLGRDFSSGKTYSEKTASEIDDEIRSIINGCYERCKDILTGNISKLHFVAEFLLKNESMDEEQFRAAMEMSNPTIESIEDIAFRKQQKSDEENNSAHKKNAEAEEEARLRREELSKRMANGEELTEELLADIFKKKYTASADNSENVSLGSENSSSDDNSTDDNSSNDSSSNNE